jgi:hypothetical protein
LEEFCSLYNEQLSRRPTYSDTFSYNALSKRNFQDPVPKGFGFERVSSDNIKDVVNYTFNKDYIDAKIQEHTNKLSMIKNLRENH